MKKWKKENNESIEKYSENNEAEKWKWKWWKYQWRENEEWKWNEIIEEWNQ